MENYLKAVYELEEFQERAATTTALAEKLNVASPSVTAMLKRLSQQEPALVNYTSHRGVTLTEVGRLRALKVIRYHRLIETFLYEVLGYTWDEVHEEAERLEHYISERFEDRLARFLGYPDFDPHGSPIPREDGSVPVSNTLPLHKLEVGRPARVVRVVHERQEVRDYVASLGIVPDATVQVTEVSPFEGPVYVRIGAREGEAVHGLGVNVAGKIEVMPV
ncbi:MAG: metal-dependent transcriptional regulator [Candidatus Hydrogenedentes bacterium]|nr:metal-dependent transcriptional regulator [Candidatus Hydrogenedentota bacterium]MBI3117158.1 metal-dependent transcriptional regulator [Candidatus Hydrogenedentota bacterium]